MYIFHSPRNIPNIHPETRGGEQRTDKAERTEEKRGEENEKRRVDKRRDKKNEERGGETRRRRG